jgi:GntR family transcriptional regulator/MocR family aminotransferase
LELIQFARQSGCYLVEDDYDSEFRYNGIPVNSLYELDNDHVIYLGTFSKVLFPSLRLGYIVLPYPLLKQCREWKRLADHHSNSVYQMALMRFIESGELERHIMRMKKIYRKRRCKLLELLETYFPQQVHIYGESAGMHIVAAFNGVNFSPELVQRINDAGVYIVPVENHAIIKGESNDQVILGYAHLNPAEMEQGLVKIKQIIRSNPQID